MVGFVLDGHEPGPGARAFAEDVACALARDGVRAHLLELVPTSTRAPCILHTIPDPEARLQTAGRSAAFELESEAVQTRPLDEAQFASCAASLAAQLGSLVESEAISVLHAVGLDLAAHVTQRVHDDHGTPYFVTPRRTDWERDGERFQARARAALRAAHGVLVFDEESRCLLEKRFAPHPGDALPNLHVGRRGVDLDAFRPLARAERRRAAAELGTRPELAACLEGIDWEHACVVLGVQAPDCRHGFEQFLFALPEILRQQPALQVIVVTLGDDPGATDGLRVALAAGRPDLLHGVLQTSEFYQSLLEHLERLCAEQRAAAWWETAARLEPERRLRFTGPLCRRDFARLLSMADVFVMPGTAGRPASQMLYEALACGVLSLAGESAGIEPVARLIAAEVSGEIAALCVLRSGGQAVRELEEKLGRILRLRPQLAERLRAVAVQKLDGRLGAQMLRRLYRDAGRAAALTA